MFPAVNEFTADKPTLRMGRFGPKTSETTDPHNSAIYACHNTSAVVQQQQVITIARKEPNLPGYTVTLSWLLCLSVQSRGKDEMKCLPNMSASIQRCTQVNWPETDEGRWSNSKFQLFTRLSEKFNSRNCYYSKFPSNISFAAERDFVLFGNINHNEQALKYQSETIAGWREGRHSKLPEGKLQFSNQLMN